MPSLTTSAESPELATAANISREIISIHSKSFALASRLLDKTARDRSVIVYAWCRRADDAVDSVCASRGGTAVARLSRELKDVFSGTPTGDPVLDGFGLVARQTRMPSHYPEQLLAGMAMDAAETDYPDWNTLFHYCYRVAGTVGLMMSHVLGVSRAAALRHAVHLGMAMQLTNICRDIREDWDRGRLYLPDKLLAQVGIGKLRSTLGRPLTIAAKAPLAQAIATVLDIADRFYRSGDQGLDALPPRGRWAIAAARGVYAEIGAVLRRQHCDVFAPRAVVSRSRKLALVARATVHSGLLEKAQGILNRSFFRETCLPTIRYPQDLGIHELLGSN